MTAPLTFLFAVGGAAAVGNLYWAQPLLGLIGHDLRTSASQAGWLATATQLGYVLGILLIVPLGDVLDRRRLIPIVFLLSAVALTACGLAPGIGTLLAASVLLGATTVGGQLLAPLAGDLADDSNRGRIVGTVASGMLTGVLLARTLSGLVADLAGWRAIFVAAAVLTLILSVLFYRYIPDLPRKASVRYHALIGSVFQLIARERMVRWTMVLAGTAFAMFSLFWTAATFLLSSPPYSYSVTGIGLLGLLGLAGVVAARRAGRLHDRGWSLPATGIAWALALVSWIVAATTGQWIAGVIATVVLLDIAVQGLNLLNQARLFSVSAEARSRLNTVFVGSNFLGGALGSSLAGILWSWGGWIAVSTAGGILAILGLTVWAIGRRTALRTIANNARG